MNYTEVKSEVDVLLEEHGYTYEKMMWMGWAGIGNLPTPRTLQRKNKPDAYTFMTVMRGTRVYDLDVRKGDGMYYTLYTFYDN
jgi:hypothetical protein